jgi:hypothetical protein
MDNTIFNGWSSLVRTVVAGGLAYLGLIGLCSVTLRLESR